jgi:hypothetical protein
MMCINLIQKNFQNKYGPHIAEFTIIQEKRFFMLRFIILEIKSLRLILSLKIKLITQAQSITMDQYLILEIYKHQIVQPILD